MSAAAPMPFWQGHHIHLAGECERVDLRAEQYKNEIGKRLRALSERGHCARQVVGWLQVQSADRSPRVLTFTRSVDGRCGDHPALNLGKLETLEDGALLTLSVKLDHRGDHLLSYNIGIRGQAKDGRGLWYARIDLHEEGDEELRGEMRGGYCNHPLLHCHIGRVSYSW